MVFLLSWMSTGAYLRTKNGFPSHFCSNSRSSIKKISKMKKKIFHIFHPPAHPLNPCHISTLGLKIKNRKRQPESMTVRCTHAKFQAIWCSRCFWGFYRFEKRSPHVMIQGSYHHSVAIRWEEYRDIGKQRVEGKAEGETGTKEKPGMGDNENP